MKKMILLVLTIVTPRLFANNCFVPGKYEGIGFFQSSNAEKGSYKITANIVDQNNLIQTYYSQAGVITLKYLISDQKIYVNESKKPSGKIECLMSSSLLSMSFRSENKEVEIQEEWTNLGNYFLRSGTKKIGTEEIKYKEMLLRQD